MKMETYRKVVTFMKRTYFKKCPISIRRVNLAEGYDGLCEKQKSKFVIKIHNKRPEFYAIDVLLHEVAHALSWDKGKDSHGMEWGKAYSRVYRAYLKEFFDQDE